MAKPLPENQGIHLPDEVLANKIYIFRDQKVMRKNYLFAGSHEAAQRAAMIYSFFAICKKHEVNPFQWLKHTLKTLCQ